MSIRSPIFTRSRRTTTHPNIPSTVSCPIPNCGMAFLKNKPSLIQAHLLSASHSTNEIRCIPAPFYNDAEVFKCPICPPQKLKLYASNRTLTNHLKTTHKTSTRTLLNQEILISHFPTADISNPELMLNWTNTLNYLQRTPLTPFSFRRSLYYRIDFKTRLKLQNIAYKVIETIIQSHAPYTEPTSRHNTASQTSSTPIWKLFLAFEGTMMAPASPNEPKNHINLIQYRITQFYLGKFDTLHRSAMKYLSPPRLDTPTTEDRSKQIVEAANNDDLKKASKLLQKPLPCVSYDATYLPKIQALHPPATNYSSPNLIPRPTESLHQSIFSNANNVLTARLRDETLLIHTLRKLKRQKSSGPFADSTDFLKDIFLVRSKSPLNNEERFPHIDLLSSLLSLLYMGKIQKEIRDYVSYNESVSFHKDPTNLDAIRPIGIGTAIRRIAAAHAMSATKDEAAQFLSPTQFAIGLSSGIDVITHSIQTHVQRYIERPAQQQSPPTRAILILDLKNMFNQVSMKKAREIIYTNFPHLLPLFDILYYDNTKCWYRKPDGRRDFLWRREGSSQGCPFAAFLASLVLSDIINTINLELSQRASLRKTQSQTSDDGQGTRALIMSYIDDTTVSIGYDDLRFFLDRFKELGEPLGCILKPQKCNILTSTDGTSPILSLSETHQSDLMYCLNTYCGNQSDGEILKGTRILGSPIGNKEFVSFYQNKTIQKLRNAVASIHHLIQDPQIATTLFKFSLQHYTTHLLFTDMIHNDNQSTKFKHYKTNFTSTITSITKQFLHELTSDPGTIHTTTLPEHAWLIATTPTGLGGLGFHDIEARALRSFTIPFAHTIRIMKHGMKPQNIPSNQNLTSDTIITLPPYHTSSFKGWKVSSLNVFQKYRQSTSKYIETTYLPKSDPPEPISLAQCQKTSKKK